MCLILANQSFQQTRSVPWSKLSNSILFGWRRQRFRGSSWILLLPMGYSVSFFSILFRSEPHEESLIIWTRSQQACHAELRNAMISRPLHIFSLYPIPLSSVSKNLFLFKHDKTLQISTLKALSAKQNEVDIQISHLRVFVNICRFLCSYTLLLDGFHTP